MRCENCGLVLTDQTAFRCDEYFSTRRRPKKLLLCWSCVISKRKAKAKEKKFTGPYLYAEPIGLTISHGLRKQLHTTCESNNVCSSICRTWRLCRERKNDEQIPLSLFTFWRTQCMHHTQEVLGLNACTDCEHIEECLGISLLLDGLNWEYND